MSEEQGTYNVEDYLQYFERDEDAIYIREDFISRLRELNGRNLFYLMSIVFQEGDQQKMIKAFESGKPVRISSNHSKKEKIPSDLRWRVWERDNFTCQHCGSRLFLTIDHVHPEAKGGKLTMENCQTLCKTCNSRKGSR
jgi:hypothetical protein